MLPLVAPENYTVIAHRGALAYAPENTVAAFTLATHRGIAAVELDNQLSTDGKAVLCQDNTL